MKLKKKLVCSKKEVFCDKYNVAGIVIIGWTLY